MKKRIKAHKYAFIASAWTEDLDPKLKIRRHTVGDVKRIERSRRERYLRKELQPAMVAMMCTFRNEKVNEFLEDTFAAGVKKAIDAFKREKAEGWHNA
jgi:hypothetical protein